MLHIRDQRNDRCRSSAGVRDGQHDAAVSDRKRHVLSHAVPCNNRESLLRGQIVIQPSSNFPVVIPRRHAAIVIVHQPRACDSRKKALHLKSDRRQLLSGNGITRIRVAAERTTVRGGACSRGCWIIDGNAELAEVSFAHKRRRNCKKVWVDACAAMIFVVGHIEESLMVCKWNRATARRYEL